VGLSFAFRFSLSGRLASARFAPFPIKAGVTASPAPRVPIMVVNITCPLRACHQLWVLACWLPSFLACLPACLLACLFAWLSCAPLACWPACCPCLACFPACLLASLACWPACFPSCLLPFLLACLLHPPRSLTDCCTISGWVGASVRAMGGGVGWV
jgi:hypothetical protein